MGWWIDMLVLLGAIALVIGIQQLRAILAMAFPKARARRLLPDTRPPAPLAELFAAAQAELAALGFSAPQWALVTPEPETVQPGVFSYVMALFLHPEQGSMVVLAPPLDLSTPNTLTTAFFTRLADGRELVSQVRNIYSEAVADQRYLAQTIDGATLAAQWRQHRRWRERFNVPCAPEYGRPETLDSVLADMRNDYDRLLQAGCLWRDKHGAARPTLAFALRILRLFWSRPRAKPDKTATPLARLNMLAAFNEHWQKRTLPARWQWLLFGVSSVLFAVLGAVFWEPLFALVLFAVIVLHEGGHYLAMRAFGYRNVQMLALPLLGGVTIGVEQHPSATRRAWMSMMGPLPGIVFGWGLLIVVPMLWPAVYITSSWLPLMAATLLVVNYLNLLPMLPLDGGHIVQAMLPLRWHGLQVVFVALTCLAGALTAWAMDLYVLVLLALFQLAGIPARLANGRAVRALAASPDFALASRPARIRLALETLHQSVGPASQAAPRIAQAEQAVLELEQKPMRWTQRLLLAAIYAGLLAVPLFYFLSMMRY